MKRIVLIITCYLANLYAQGTKVAREFRKLSKDEQKDVIEDAERLLDIKLFHEQLEGLIKKAEQAIVRHSINDEQAYTHRGGIIYLEELRKKFETIVKLKKN